MPKASVYEDDGAVLGKHDIRFSGKVFSMQAEAKAVSMQHRPNLFFRICVGPLNAGHHPAASSGINNIRHSAAAR